MPASYTVSVRELCAFSAKEGDLDLRFTPSPTAAQGREGHQLVAHRRGAGYEAELSLTGDYTPPGETATLHVRGRADGFDAQQNLLEEVKTFRGRLEAIAPNHQALHWAQLKVYGALLCKARGFKHLTLAVVYFDVIDQDEQSVVQEATATELQDFFEAQCQQFWRWAQRQIAHRRVRDAALAQMEFPQKPFRPGQHAMASGVYRACVQAKPLLVQAPTGIGKTIGTLFPALRAMPESGGDKLFFLTAKTPGRQVALQALHTIREAGTGVPLRVLELVAKEKSCEHKDKACHGESCPLANGFYDRLPAARQVAATAQWLDQSALREVALAHQVCTYYLSHEMLRWADVVVGDYNYYFDRGALLHSLTQHNRWRVSVLVDEAHNLYSRASAMYSAQITLQAALALLPDAPQGVRNRLRDWIYAWQLMLSEARSGNPSASWQQLEELPEALMRSLLRLNSAISEHLNEHPTQQHGALLPFYFDTLAFASLAESFGEHSLCELDLTLAPGDTAAPTAQMEIDSAVDSYRVGSLTLRCIEPGHFLAHRIQTAQPAILFSATLHPLDYHQQLLGLPQTTTMLDVPSPFDPAQLQVRVLPLSTRRDRRAASLPALVGAMQRQFAAEPGNYLAFFSSFDYMEAACALFACCTRR